MTWEEILKAMKADTAIQKEVIKFIITTEDGKEVLENHAKQYSEKAIGEKVSEIYNGIDAITTEVLGASKAKDKKTSEHIKDLLTELKTLKEKKGGDNPEGDAKKVKDLEAELAKAKDWETKYNGLTQETAAKIEGYTKQIDELKNGNTESIVGNDLVLGFSSLKFNPLIPKEAIDAMAEKVKGGIMKNAKIVDGKPVYYKEDGTPYLNEVYKPITANEIYASELKAVLATGAAGGGGAETEKGKIVTIKDGDKEAKKVVLDPSKFNTKLTFAQHIEEVLIENGVENNSKEWHEIVQSARTEYEVDKMDRV
jgi:hypothetical protein